MNELGSMAASPSVTEIQVPLRVAKLEALVYRAPVRQPVQTSFGTMYDRPAVLVRAEDHDGYVGWGEIWCNFPGVGAEHRARVLASCVAPIVLEQSWNSPKDAFDTLTRRLHILGIQSGEPGTIAQTIAGADIALWDLAARRLGQPLWQLLGGTATIGAYASGISPTEPAVLALAKRDEGYRAFKLKVGFGAERDIANLDSMRRALGDDATLMIDANQAWTADEALSMSRRLAPFNPIWLEEPMPADASQSDWQRLAGDSAIPLAAGENVRGAAAFDEIVDSGTLAVIQPDLGKWGGFSGCVPVGHRAVARGRMFCPHWLGGGLGLVASMHLKAIAGGPGYVEVDSNPNPLRDALAGDSLRPRNGNVTLENRPGLGLDPDLGLIGDYLVDH